MTCFKFLVKNLKKSNCMSENVFKAPEPVSGFDNMYAFVTY